MVEAVQENIIEFAFNDGISSEATKMAFTDGVRWLAGQHADFAKFLVEKPKKQAPVIQNQEESKGVEQELAERLENLTIEEIQTQNLVDVTLFETSESLNQLKAFMTCLCEEEARDMCEIS